MDLSKYRAKLKDQDGIQIEGVVCATQGPALRVRLPDARMGEVIEIAKGDHIVRCEVVAFDEEATTLMPLGDIHGIGPGDRVRNTGMAFRIRCSEKLLGRVLGGLGEAIDGKGPVEGALWDVMRTPPKPLERQRISAVLPTGIRCIDGLLTLGHGQRVGLFAGSGAGKSMLLGQIARQAAADVAVVCLVGERGREVREFLEDCLDEDALKRSVVVCATSDEAALVRLKSAYVATSIAEWFRDQGKRVLLLMDSVTRFARAAREVGLAAGEPPTRRGYPPSVFAALPALMERSGNSASGSVTAFYTVLVEGGDLEEPIADETRGILDGHVVLDRHLGSRGRFPAIDVLHSLSRTMDRLVDPQHIKDAQRLREYLEVYESNRDLITLGAYKPGSNLLLDDALHRLDALEGFLRQSRQECSDFAATAEALHALVQ